LLGLKPSTLADRMRNFGLEKPARLPVDESTK
jgi:hypothetical protein